MQTMLSLGPFQLDEADYLHRLEIEKRKNMQSRGSLNSMGSKLISETRDSLPFT